MSGYSHLTTYYTTQQTDKTTGRSPDAKLRVPSITPWILVLSLQVNGNGKSRNHDLCLFSFLFNGKLIDDAQ